MPKREYTVDPRKERRQGSLVQALMTADGHIEYRLEVSLPKKTSSFIGEGLVGLGRYRVILGRDLRMQVIMRGADIVGQPTMPPFLTRIHK